MDDQLLGIRDYARRNNRGTPRAPTVSILPHRVLGLRLTATINLPATVRDIVARCIAEDVVESFIFGDIEGGRFHDDYKLALIVHRTYVYTGSGKGQNHQKEWRTGEVSLVLVACGHRDRPSRGIEGREWLVEEDGELGNCDVGLQIRRFVSDTGR